MFSSYVFIWANLVVLISNVRQNNAATLAAEDSVLWSSSFVDQMRTDHKYVQRAPVTSDIIRMSRQIPQSVVKPQPPPDLVTLLLQLLGLDESDDFGTRPSRGVLSGPINRDPTGLDFDRCKCAYRLNCNTPGFSFGHCDVGKQYCCYASKDLVAQNGGGGGYGLNYGFFPPTEQPLIYPGFSPNHDNTNVNNKVPPPPSGGGYGLGPDGALRGPTP